jgi:hypothetical protein
MQGNFSGAGFRWRHQFGPGKKGTPQIRRRTQPAMRRGLTQMMPGSDPEIAG